MHYLLHLDKELFKLINGRWHNDLFDAIMPIIRNSLLWYPFYLFLIVFILVNYKKHVWWWICFAACTAVLTNFISSDIIKENIIRTRPCNDPELGNSVRFLLNYRPQSSSFTSSHATNHFGLAAFFYFTLKNSIGKWAYLFFFWAFIIVYAQVYVGVHYPIDIICGGLIGFVFGYLSARSYNNNYGLV